MTLTTKHFSIKPFVAITLLSLITSLQGAIIFTVNTTATNSALGYLSGQDYNFSFTYNSASTSPNHNFIAGRRLYFSEEQLSEQELWSDVKGDGLAGTWARPSVFSGSPDSELNANQTRFDLHAFADGAATIGLTANGVPLEGIDFEATYAGLNFDFTAPAELNPNIYYSNYLGTYNATATNTGVVDSDGAGNANFTINTLTISSIVPEPSGVLLVCAGGLGLLVTRRRRE